MNKRHYEHTLPNIRGSLSNTYDEAKIKQILESRHKIQGDMSIRGSSFSTHARK